jgi:transcriptional regulator with XRE-family HTH domain
MESLNEQLKMARRFRGMKANELSRKSGIPAATISLIEHGRLNPTAETVERLAKALDCGIAIFPILK